MVPSFNGPIYEGIFTNIYQPKALVVTESYLFIYVSSYLSTVQLFSFARN